MLHALSIRNFAVVEQLEIEFDSGFTVLTGETGAGKSILLDALSLLLGDRFETRQLRVGGDRRRVPARRCGHDSRVSRRAGPGRRRAAAAPANARRAGTEPRLDQRSAGYAGAARRRRREPGLAARPAR